MEKRVLLAIVLMVAVIVLTNVLFPPSPPAPAGGGARDTAARVEGAAGPDTAPPGDTGAVREPDRRAAGETDGEGEELQQAAPGDTAPPDTARREQDEAASIFREQEKAEPGDTIRVTTPLFDLSFSTRGATLVEARLDRYASFHPDEPKRTRASLVRTGDRLLGWQVTDGTDTLDLRGRLFQTDSREIRLEEGDSARSLTFRYPIPGRPGLT